MCLPLFALAESAFTPVPAFSAQTLIMRLISVHLKTDADVQADLEGNSNITPGGPARLLLFQLEKDAIYVNHGAYGAAFRWPLLSLPSFLAMSAMFEGLWPVQSLSAMIALKEGLRVLRKPWRLSSNQGAFIAVLPERGLHCIASVIESKLHQACYSKACDIAGLPMPGQRMHGCPGLAA